MYKHKASWPRFIFCVDMAGSRKNKSAPSACPGGSGCLDEGDRASSHDRFGGMLVIICMFCVKLWAQ